MKIFFWTIAVLFLMGSSCEEADPTSVMIYTGISGSRAEYLQQQLNEQFPDYMITLQVLSTNTLTAQLQAEKTRTDADIILGLETGLLESVQDFLADLSSFDVPEFLPELVPASKRFLPWDRSSGTIAINRARLESDGLPIPYFYRDLLHPVYRGLVAMPNPTTSRTGYLFLVSLINAWSEDAAFEYFDRLAENNLQWTVSDTSPINSLIKDEAAIGLGMTVTAVNAINNHGAFLDLLYFAEGAPYVTTGFGIIKGKEKRPIVREVFTFIMTTLISKDKELFSPEPVLINQVSSISNYPLNIPYAHMDGVYDQTLKERLLERWNH